MFCFDETALKFRIWKQLQEIICLVDFVNMQATIAHYLDRMVKYKQNKICTGLLLVCFKNIFMN